MEKFSFELFCGNQDSKRKFLKTKKKKILSSIQNGFCYCGATTPLTKDIKTFLFINYVNLYAYKFPNDIKFYFLIFFFLSTRKKNIFYYVCSFIFFAISCDDCKQQAQPNNNNNNILNTVPTYHFKGKSIFFKIQA